MLAKQPVASSLEVAQYALAAYLKCSMKELTDVTPDFPNRSENLEFPLISLTHSSEQYTNLVPYELVTPDPADVNNKTQVVWVVGQWDFKIQVDIWATNKPERNKIFEHFRRVFNNTINPMGLSLTLNDFYGLIARYDMDASKHVDGEQAAQRKEWRTMVSLLVHVKDALSQDQYLITKPIVNNLTLKNTSESIDT